MKKSISILLAIILVFSSLTIVSAEETTSVKEVTIIHDTHFHGNFGKKDNAENILNYFSLVTQIRSQKPNSIFVGSGDDLASSVESAIFMGEHIVDAFNAVKMDANTYGNHDFDMGPDQLAAMVEKSTFPWVSANLIDKRTNDVVASEKGAKRFVIKEVNGVKLGITGLINEEAPEITSLGENAVVVNPVEAMEKIIPEMKSAGAEIIVVLSHLSGVVAEDVAAKVDGIDVIVGDHAGNVYDEPKKVNNTIVSFVGDEFKYLGELTLSIDNGKIVDYQFVKHSLEDEADSIPVDPVVQEVVEGYWTKLDSEFGKVVGKTEVDLDTSKSVVRKQEAVIGNYLTDTLREWAKADVALVAGGGIRSDKVYPVGSLTKGDIMAILPFTNYAVKLELTGAQIKEALENGVSMIEDGAGRFPQVSGISFVYDLSKQPGSRIIEVKVAGQPLDVNKTYTLATLDFLSGGGDGYEVFTQAKTLIDSNGGPLFSSLIIETLQKSGTINAKIEGRIKEASSATPKQEEPKQEAPKEQPKPEVKKDIVYVVKAGDVLWKIAKKYGFNYQEVAKYNNLKNPHLIFVGQKILIPAK